MFEHPVLYLEMEHQIRIGLSNVAPHVVLPVFPPIVMPPWLVPDPPGIVPESDDDDELPYEVMLELCEQMGDHYVGVSNIDACTPEVQAMDLPAEGRCAICLDAFLSIELDRTMRRITTCGHVFCDECIRPWLERHRWCPVCRQCAEPETPQIASISRESSPSPSPSEPLPDLVSDSESEGPSAC